MTLTQSTWTVLPYHEGVHFFQGKDGEFTVFVDQSLQES